MSEEFNLSDKEVNSDNVPINLNKFYAEKDVKEFIKRLKEHCPRCSGARKAIKSGISDICLECQYIDKLAGDKLI